MSQNQGYLTYQFIKICPPHCTKTKLLNLVCSCTLDYFFVTCRIKLAGWINKQVFLSNGEILELSPQTLMDYGMVSLVLFNDSDQTNNFGKQLALAILKKI